MTQYMAILRMCSKSCDIMLNLVINSTEKVFLDLWDRQYSDEGADKKVRSFLISMMSFNLLEVRTLGKFFSRHGVKVDS